MDWHLQRFTNPKVDKILALTRRFDKKWAENLERRIAAEEGLKDAINSIVANRHLVAHGRDTDLSYRRIRDFYDTAGRVVDLLEGVCAS